MEKTLVHVYKSGSFGFGDFIRGIPVLKQLADECCVTYKVAINHPMAKFLDVDTTPYVTTHKTANKDEIKATLSGPETCIVLESNIASGTIPYPRGLLTSYIKPSAALLADVKDKMRVLGIREKEFVVFHVRCGDADFKSSSKDTPEYNSLIRRIGSYLQIVKVTNPCPIVFISSSDEVIRHFAGQHRILTTGLKRCHTGDTDADSEALHDTLVEFYLMTFAKKIYSASGTGFGAGSSGFSYWLARAFGIPRTHFDADI